MRILITLLAVALLSTYAAAQATPPSTDSSAQPPAHLVKKKKLIEFGWDEPDTVFLRRHHMTMEKTPFDGCVFHLPGDFLWQSWCKRTFTEAELAGALDDLRHTPTGKLTHNFLRFNVAPGEVDWFDDFSPVLANARLAARFAREGKAAGVLFDIEQYNFQLFDFRKQRDTKTKSWDQYAAQAKQRGREVMEAFQEGYPDLTVFLTFGYSLPYAQVKLDKTKLAEVDYGLLLPFLDGMFEAARGKSVIVDGFEISYGYKEPKQFNEAAVSMKQTVLPMIADAEKYRKHGSLGFGLWMDNDWRNKAWDERDVSRNHFMPEQFEQSLRKAMETADEYVWIYTETPK
ncbi:MAG: hypothetical protein ABIP55_04215, partial [Tepidisphaeraceae bacterium]